VYEFPVNPKACFYKFLGTFGNKKLEGIVKEMEERRKKWLKSYKTKLDLNDVLEIRNPQSVIEFVPEIMVNL
jgi:hypothetical protein